MPVALFTGLPGSGKTASLVKRILDLREKEPGRPIFQFGINGLKPDLAAPLTQHQLEHWWEELPPGSIICIDECQEDGTNPDQPISLMPKDRGAPAPWVQRITKVRHYGIDFLLTTQHPANMSAYVRRLVDFHQHAVMRSKGVRQTFTWMRCIDDPDNRREKKTAEMSFAPLPKEVFELYKSSSLHTMKVRTPRIVYLVVAGAVLAVFLAFFIPYRIHQAAKPMIAAPVDDPSVHVDDALRHNDFVKWSTPRVSGLPWTAPMFDKLTVQAQPRLYCMSLETGECNCITEQGTHVDVSLSMCHQAVKDGVYNPFIPPADGQADDKSDKKSAAQHQPPAAADARLTSTDERGRPSDAMTADDTSYGDRATAAAYVPPQLTHEALQAYSAPAAHQ